MPNFRVGSVNSIFQKAVKEASLAAFLPQKRITQKRDVRLLAIVLGYTSCSKKTKLYPNHTDGRLYIRIAQVDKDGTIQYGRVPKVRKD